MSISDREKSHWYNKGSDQYFSGKDYKNPHEAPTFVEVGDTLFGTILGPNNRMERQEAFRDGFVDAKKGR